MQNEDSTLYKMEALGKESVEEAAKDQHKNDHQGSVPCLGDIVRVVEDHKALDLCTSQERGKSAANLPSEHSEPA